MILIKFFLKVDTNIPKRSTGPISLKSNAFYVMVKNIEIQYNYQYESFYIEKLTLVTLVECEF